MTDRNHAPRRSGPEVPDPRHVRAPHPALDEGVRVEGRLGDSVGGSTGFVELRLEDLRDAIGRVRRVLVPVDTVQRLRDGLTTSLNTLEAFWYSRSEAARDVHRGVLDGEGTVNATCGVQFRPQGPPLRPTDPQRICLACCRLIPW
ncbi:MAG: hypothetical protein JO115_09935 [Pseudonocardiales bacterium]|nr:hypothetical protein [Pseudonocardiales bacterium]